MNKLQVVVLCPSRYVTGGVEALHQLALELHRSNRVDCYLSYIPNFWRRNRPSDYFQYEVPTVNPRAIPKEAVVIIPEVWVEYANQLPNKKVLWWLSFNNFNRSYDSLLNLFDWHFAQSIYAQVRVKDELGIDTLPLSDYVNPIFHHHVRTLTSLNADIALNPAKGKSLIDEFKSRARDLSFMDLTRASRLDFISMLDSCKIYIDFGHFPGKDRIPREATARGLPVLVNSCGAAENPRDFKIDDWYRFSSVDEAFDKSRQVLQDLDGHRERQKGFLHSVQAEHSIFSKEVHNLIEVINR